jgi:hypothetical protein
MLAAILALFSYAGAAESPDAPRTISVNELRPGMKGYGLTVVKGDSIERFDVEILDVLRGIAPGRRSIIFRASGLGLENSGIIAGMSGSPVYIDGRLAGAVAFGWQWPKEPIAGITPIEDMEQALDVEPVAASDPATWNSSALVRFLDPAARLAASPAASSAMPAAFSPMAVPLVMPALSPQARAIAESFFPPDRFFFAEGLAGSAAAEEAAASATLLPGSSVFVALVTGDMTMGATGTVTDVRGNDVYGFGHPFLNRDGIAIPMYTSRVVSVFPNLQKSFKIAYPLKEVGAITRDRATGIKGVLGAPSRTVPLSITISRPGGERAYSYKIFRHYAMTGQLVATVAAATATSLGDLSDETTVSYRLIASYAGGRSVDYRWQTAGKDSLAAMAKDVSALVEATMSNPLEKLDPEDIALSVVLSNVNAAATIESATVSRNEVAPGEAITAVVRLKPVLGASVEFTVSLAVPANAMPGQRSLIVSDGRTASLTELQQNPRLLSPASIDELLKVIVPRFGADELVARLADLDQGVAVGTSVYPSLPSSALAVLSAPQSGTLTPLRRGLTASVVTPYVVMGKCVIPVKIVNRSERQ